MTSTKELARIIIEVCGKRPANAAVPSSALSCGQVAQVADGYESMDFMVQHLHRERMRIVRAIGLQIEGPDACQDGYPDLSALVEEALRQARAEVAAANQRAWRAEQRAGIKP